jgi:hypothetical protein
MVYGGIVILCPWKSKSVLQWNSNNNQAIFDKNFADFSFNSFVLLFYF